ncbi:aldo/keto reductase [Candidatus Haliotispira prima]|uniref:Aldo/keto reductase n=1 Tax=Candidatus Haliotispira prima TaxID=3034016 RepID=A0ABY8MJE0_9SPIO|nr:aldo/keto reductase [Candidatus Haliotispira prima]
MQKIIDQTEVTLNNGRPMAVPGLGTADMLGWRAKGPEFSQLLEKALDLGYRHIDTASFYGNEEGIGTAIKNSPVKREDIMLVSKVWNSEQGYEETQAAFRRSLERLGTDYLDLYLIHWPKPDQYLDTWRAMEKLYAEGLIKAIGLSNFHKKHIEDILEHGTVLPAANQLEIHPYLQQQELVDFCRQCDIQVVGWSPLGTGNWSSVAAEDKPLNDAKLQELAQKQNKTVAQIILRWNLQRGIVPIPKSNSLQRIRENLDIFSFSLSEQDMQEIAQLDTNNRLSRQNPEDTSTWVG